MLWLVGVWAALLGSSYGAQWPLGAFQGLFGGGLSGGGRGVKFYQTLSDGSKVCGCFDPSTGLHEHDSSWVSGFRFKMRCNNGTTEVEACIGSRRGNYVEVPLNETKDVNGFYHKCEETAEGMIKYEQEPSCLVKGEELHVNDTFRQGNFKLQCEVWGYSIAGCYYGDGDNATELGLGETADEEHLRHFCEEVEGSGGRVRYRVQAVKCRHEGELRDEGESWSGEHLKYLCKENGAIAIINCLTGNGTEVAVGQAIVEEEKLHRCFRLGSTVYYQSHSCPPNSALCSSGLPLFRPLPVPSPHHAGMGINPKEYPLLLPSNLDGRVSASFMRPFFRKR